MNNTNKGLFIMLDGIDGSGKSTIVQAWQTYLIEQGKKVFSIRDYWEEHGAHPTEAELSDFDVIISAEPSYIWTGAAIRNEMIHEDAGYSSEALANAYALDRLVLYKRVLLPFKQAGKIIIQDRGVSTSLCYQPLQGDLTMSEVATIEGNAFALSHAPDVLFLSHITPKNAIARLDNRTEEQDNAVFEKLPFLEKAHACFHGKPFKEYFEKSGSTVVTLNTDTTPTQMKDSAVTALISVLS